MKGRIEEAGSAAEQGAEHGARRSRWPWLRLGFWTGGALVLAFALGFGLFSSHVGRLMTPQALAKADAIIVLTGGQSRIDTAVDLLKSGKGKRLLISGVNPIARPEDLRRATGAEKSLFSCCVDIDHAALDTIGNAEESAKWMHANAFSSAILVTNNYHMPRSLLEMRRLGGDIEFEPYPVVNTRIDRGEWLLNADALRVLFTEYTKYLAAIARGILDGHAGVATASPLDTAEN